MLLLNFMIELEFIFLDGNYLLLPAKDSAEY
ncbi:hypothetical protein BD65_2910 [Yersinia ruckeri]|nr:hypothetical protein BD65_2910 [Yersinia ruckeri]